MTNKPNAVPAAKLAYSVAGFAEAISLSKSRVWELIDEGAIKPKRCGRRVLIPNDEAQRFISNLESVAA